MGLQLPQPVLGEPHPTDAMADDPWLLGVGGWAIAHAANAHGNKSIVRCTKKTS